MITVLYDDWNLADALLEKGRSRAQSWSSQAFSQSLGEVYRKVARQ